MLLTPHTAAGIAIGAAIPNPIISVPLAFLSHFGLDLVPHWDDVGLAEVARLGRLPRRAFRIILLDGLIALSFLLYFLYWAMPDYGIGITIFASAFAANLPDMFYIPIVFWGKRWNWAIWMAKLQVKLQGKAPLAWGISLQTFLVAICSLVARQEILAQLPQVWRIL